MDIVFQAHHAEISDHMRERAVRTIRKVARRAGQAVDAVVRFEQDGRLRRVELVLHSGRNRRLIAEGSDRFFGPALAAAAARLSAQCGGGRGRRRATGGVR